MESGMDNVFWDVGICQAQTILDVVTGAGGASSHLIARNVFPLESLYIGHDFIAQFSFSVLADRYLHLCGRVCLGGC